MKPDQIAGTSESSQQRALFAQAALHMGMYPELRWLHHIPNGGHRSAVAGANMKADGVKKGVVDIFLPVPSYGFHGLYIEMKKPGKLGSTTPAQKEFLEFVNSEAYDVGVHDNWENAWQHILLYLEGRPK